MNEIGGGLEKIEGGSVSSAISECDPQGSGERDFVARL
jgi:hypothetical protein